MAISILIVEDDPIYREALKQVVEDAEDMELAGVAGDFASGIAFLNRKPADILLVDLGLPDGDGIELIKTVTGRWHNQCDVLVISMFDDAKHVIPAFEAGALGYLLKDSSLTATAQLIREFHSGGSHITPAIARVLLHHKFPQIAANFSTNVDKKNPLTKRQYEALRHLAKGYSYKEVARLMGISKNTVDTLVIQVYEKLGVHNKQGAVNEADRLGIKLN